MSDCDVTIDNSILLTVFNTINAWLGIPLFCYHVNIKCSEVRKDLYFFIQKENLPKCIV